jgi:hypothetical protein
LQIFYVLASTLPRMGFLCPGADTLAIDRCRLPRMGFLCRGADTLAIDRCRLPVFHDGVSGDRLTGAVFWDNAMDPWSWEVASWSSLP